MNRIITISIFFILATATFAQKPFVLGVIDTIASKELSETRTLNIYLPEGYSAKDSTRYPVIYLLDGSANEDFVHIVGLVQFLNMTDTMPKAIVVGIANVDRRRDFTFPTTIAKDKQDYPTTGSSAKFISFIEKELQPFVEKKYRTNSTKAIIGQSLGGLLACEILLKKPTLFNKYMIVSPSLWWDKESLLSLAPDLLKKQNDLSMDVYVSVGAQEEKIMIGDAELFSELIQKYGSKKAKLYYEPLAAENHLTILHNSIYKGFEILFPNKR